MSDNEQRTEPAEPTEPVEPKMTVGQRVAQGALNIALWPVIAVMTLMWRRKK